MGSNITILKDYLNGIADAIRYRGNTTDAIRASDFKTAIRNLPVNIIYNVPTNEETGKPDEIIQVMNYYYPEYISFQDYKGDKISLEGLRTNKITYMNDTFKNCNYLLKIDVSNFNTENVTNMYQTFLGCSNLQSLNLSNFNGSNVLDINQMFEGCGNLVSINLANFNAHKLSNLSYINISNTAQWKTPFQSCNNLTSLDMSDFNGCNIKYLGKGFQSLVNLTTLNLSKFNATSLLSLYQVFRECHNLSTLNMYGFNGRQIANLASAFYNCYNLPNVDFLNTEISTELVENWGSCFSSCRNLQSFNYSNVKLDNATYLSGLFSSCINIKDINLSYSTLSNVNNFSGFCSGCSNLQTVDLSGFNGEHYGININMQSAFSQCSNLTSVIWDWSLSNIATIANLFYHCNNLSSIIDFSNQDLGARKINQSTFVDMITGCSNLVGLNFSNCNGSCFTYFAKPSNMYHGHSTFWNYPSQYHNAVFNGEAESFIDMSNFNGGNITNMARAFYNGSMRYLNLANFNAAKVNSIERLCSECICLRTINLDNFGNNLTNGNALVSSFYNCQNLTTLQLSNLGVINGASLSSTFYNTAKLSTIDLTNTIITNVANLSSTFKSCGLETIDLSMFNFANSVYIDRTFENSRAKTINFGNQLPNQTFYGTLQSLFTNCDLESFNMSEFPNCDNHSLTYMFHSSHIKNIDLTGYNPTANFNIAWTFCNCQNLQSLNFGNIDFSKVFFSNTYCSFNNTSNLTSVSGMLNLNASLYIFQSSDLTERSVMNIINNAIDQTQFNRTLTLAVGSESNNSISESNRAYAESIGWRIQA